jgi:hypothetical protein
MCATPQHLVGILPERVVLRQPGDVQPDPGEPQFAEQHPWVAHLYLLNPLTVIITAYRAVITGVAAALGARGLAPWP